MSHHVASGAVFCRTVLFFSVTWCVSPDRLLLQRWQTSSCLQASTHPSGGQDLGRWKNVFATRVALPRRSSAGRGRRSRWKKLDGCCRNCQKVWPSGSVFESISVSLIPFSSSRFCETTVTGRESSRRRMKYCVRSTRDSLPSVAFSIRNGFMLTC